MTITSFQAANPIQVHSRGQGAKTVINWPKCEVDGRGAGISLSYLVFAQQFGGYVE